MRIASASSLLFVLLTAACSTGEGPLGPVPPAAPPPPLALNAELGRLAFEASCASCHVRSEGFDLALFGFSEADIVRRGSHHVSETTARNIAAYVRSLGIQPIGRNSVPFQPGSRVTDSDAQFWRDLFGTDGWPEQLTPEALAAIDVRKLNAPLQLPLWSVENGDGDWLSDAALDPALVQYDGGALDAAIAAYRADPTTARLLQAVSRFETATRQPPSAACEGITGAHVRPRACFEARRWMSAFAAVHFLRQRAAEVPVEVIRLWWATGEASVTLFFFPPDGRRVERPAVAGWLYLGFSYAPTAFPEENGYLGQFTVSSGFPRLAVFTALRRMVGQGEVHFAGSNQRFRDAFLAALRAPDEIKAEALRFAYRFLLRRLDAGERPSTQLLSGARTNVNAAFGTVDERVQAGWLRVAPALLNEITTLRDELTRRLQ
ncbi:MAG: hypothetical protein HOP28_00700 [Gemmatimonadales bacterium]|nr:hypothetical protein [Gemmatimonadales bacterium]